MQFAARLPAVTLLLAASMAMQAVAQPAPAYPPSASPYPPPAASPYPPPAAAPYSPPAAAPYSPPAAAPPPAPAYRQVPPRDDQFSPGELIDAGHLFFGGVSRGLAMIVQRAGSEWGQPNGYILGEEA